MPFFESARNIVLAIVETWVLTVYVPPMDSGSLFSSDNGLCGRHVPGDCATTASSESNLFTKILLTHPDHMAINIIRRAYRALISKFDQTFQAIFFYTIPRTGLRPVYRHYRLCRDGLLILLTAFIFTPAILLQLHYWLTVFDFSSLIWRNHLGSVCVIPTQIPRLWSSQRHGMRIIGVTLLQLYYWLTVFDCSSLSWRNHLGSVCVSPYPDPSPMEQQTSCMVCGSLEGRTSH